MRAQHTLRCKGIPSVLNRTKFGIPSTRRVGVFSRPRTKTASRVVVIETGEHTACVRAWSELQEHFRHAGGKTEITIDLEWRVSIEKIFINAAFGHANSRGVYQCQ